MIEILFASVVAAVAASITVAVSLKLWMMFIGWISFSTAGGDVRKGAVAVISTLVGILLAMGAITIVGLLHPVLGVFALPLAVFGLAVVALLLPFTPVSSVPGCFLGMTAFFAASLPPGGSALVQLAAAGVIGAVGAALVTVTRGRLRRRI